MLQFAVLVALLVKRCNAFAAAIAWVGAELLLGIYRPVVVRQHFFEVCVVGGIRTRDPVSNAREQKKWVCEGLVLAKQESKR